MGCMDPVGCPRVVFVTTNAFVGALGGLAGADAKCQAAADASSLPTVRGRTYVAWISTLVIAADKRLVHGTGMYVRPDGAMVAKNYDDFVGGNLTHAMSVDENGEVTAGPAWTGTNEKGESTKPTCAEWSDAPPMTGGAVLNGLTGDVTGTDKTWSANQEVSCASTARLYCIER